MGAEETAAEALPERQRGWHRRVWLLAGPIILSNLATPLLGAVDTAVMGHLPSPAYLGGVAVGALVFNFLYWGFGFLRMGTTGFTAQAFGAGRETELRACLARPMLLAVALGLVLIALQVPIALVAFPLIGAGQEVEDLARAYFDVRIWSAPFSLLNYALLGWLLGIQRAGSVLVLQVSLNGVNILLDLWFVLGLGWGIEGVAWASLIAEACASALGLAMCLRILARRGGRWDWARIVERKSLAALLRVNADILVRTLCLIFAFSYLTAQGARLGEVTLAANAVLMQFQHFLAYGLDGFAHAAEILAGGAYGARRRDAFRQAVLVSGQWALAMALVATALFWGLGESIVALFTDLEEVRREAGRYLPYLIAAPLVSVWSFQLDGIFIGATRSAQMRNAMLVTLAIFLVACWTLIPLWGNHGLWSAFIVLMLARAATLGFCYPALERSVEMKGAES